MMEGNIFGHAAEWELAASWLLSVVNKTSQKNNRGAEKHRIQDLHLHFLKIGHYVCFIEFSRIYTIVGNTWQI